MYCDNDSIKVFERIHARDRLVELARTHSGDPDTDLITARAGSGWHEGWIVCLLSLATILGLAAAAVLTLL